MKKKLAQLISRIFEPMIIMSVLVVVATLYAGEGLPFLFFVFFAMVVPTLALRIWYVRKKGVDWDIGDRKKRILPLFVLLVLVVVDVVLVSLWKNPFLTRTFIMFLAWIIGYFAITLFWKISGHTSIITLASLLILEWYGWQFWPVLLTIPLVVWARIIGKNHTAAQTIGGIVYSVLLHEVWKSLL